jgi:hypothetical protein
MLNKSIDILTIDDSCNFLMIISHITKVNFEVVETDVKFFFTIKPHF